MPRLVTHKEIMEMFNIGKSKAYEIIRQLNHELIEMGFLVAKGRVPYNYVIARYHIKEDHYAH